MARRPGSVSPAQRDPRPPPELILARDHPRATLAELERRQEITRVRRGAYVARSALSDLSAHTQDRVMALARASAVAHQLGAAVLSHETAAAVWGLPLVSRTPDTHVVQRSTPSSRSAPDVVRHVLTLGPGEVTEHHGLPVTSLERTVVDCATTLRLEPALILADAALHLGADLELCSRILASLGRRRGTARARTVLHYADGGAESPGETRTRLVLLRTGLPTPQTQVPVRLPHGTYYADLGWPALKLLVEYDGTAKYTARGTAAAAVLEEKRREELICEAGFKLVRVIREDLRAGGLLIARLRALARFPPPSPRPDLHA